MCTKGKKLIACDGEFRLRREVIREIGGRIRDLRGSAIPPRFDGGSPFDFGARAFVDVKIAALLQELRKCYPQECWNACGLLIRIIVERALDTADAGVRSKVGLRDKINSCRGLGVLFQERSGSLGRATRRENHRRHRGASLKDSSGQERY